LRSETFYLIVRIYEQIFGWRAGLDSFAPEFQTYWLSILWTEIPLELVSASACRYLWKTRDRNVDAVQHVKRCAACSPGSMADGLRRRHLLGASFFTEQDGTWHRLDSRHGLYAVAHHQFYMSYPIYSIIRLRVLLCEDPHSVFCSWLLTGS